MQNSELMPGRCIGEMGDTVEGQAADMDNYTAEVPFRVLMDAVWTQPEYS